MIELVRDYTANQFHHERIFHVVGFWQRYRARSQPWFGLEPYKHSGIWVQRIDRIAALRLRLNRWHSLRSLRAAPSFVPALAHRRFYGTPKDAGVRRSQPSLGFVAPFVSNNNISTGWVPKFFSDRVSPKIHRVVPASM